MRTALALSALVFMAPLAARADQPTFATPPAPLTVATDPGHPPSVGLGRSHDVLAPLAAPLAVEIPAHGHKFYGWQSIIADGVGATMLDAGLLFALAKTDKDLSSTFIALGAIVEPIAGMGIHIGHDKGTKALASLGFTAGVPITGALVGLGAGAAGCHDNGCRNRTLIWSSFAAVTLSPLLDGLALGWSKNRSNYTPPRRAAKLVDQVSPTFTPVRGGGFVGISGTLG